MPVLRKLTDEEIATLRRNSGHGVRVQIEKEYDAIVADLSPGEYHALDLTEEEAEQKSTIRNRLKAAATRRNLTIRFIKTSGNAIRFLVLTDEDLPFQLKQEEANELVTE